MSIFRFMRKMYIRLHGSQFDSFVQCSVETNQIHGSGTKASMHHGNFELFKKG